MALSPGRLLLAPYAEHFAPYHHYFPPPSFEPNHLMTVGLHVEASTVRYGEGNYRLRAHLQETDGAS